MNESSMRIQVRERKGLNVLEDDDAVGCRPKKPKIRGIKGIRDIFVCVSQHAVAVQIRLNAKLHRIIGDPVEAGPLDGIISGHSRSRLIMVMMVLAVCSISTARSCAEKT